MPGPAQEDVYLGLDRGLDDEPGTQAHDILDDLPELPRAVVQGVDLTTDRVGRRYSCRHGRSPPIVELVAPEGTYVRRHSHRHEH
jgi:hypothetical protein